MKIPLLFLCNEHLALDEQIGRAVELANEQSTATAPKPAPDWIELPYGNWDHKKGVQVFDRASAEMMLENFKSAQSPRFKGLPIYEGHPDVDEFANRWTDKSAKAWIKDMEVTDSALRLRVDWNAAGRDLVSNEKYAYYSPTWAVKKIDGHAAAWRPNRLKSVGLVNDPNIGVMPLTNEQQKSTGDKTMLPPWLLTLLGLPETATEEEVKNALTEKMKKVGASVKPETVANEAVGASTGFFDWLKSKFTGGAEDCKEGPAAYAIRSLMECWENDQQIAQIASEIGGVDTLKNEKPGRAVKVLVNEHVTHAATETTLTNERAAKTKVETELANERTARATAETAFANERRARVELIVANAISAGKLRLADKDAKVTELSNAAADKFAAVVTALANAGRVLPVRQEAHTKNLGQRKESSEAMETITVLVNERMTTKHVSYDDAWDYVRRSKPELFANMKQPAKAS